MSQVNTYVKEDWEDERWMGEWALMCHAFPKAWGTFKTLSFSHLPVCLALSYQFIPGVHLVVQFVLQLYLLWLGDVSRAEADVQIFQLSVQDV